MNGPAPTVVQLSRTTARPAERVIDDLASLRLGDAVVAERGRTYLVLAPPRGRGYRSGHAVALCVLVVFLVLVLSAWWVVAVAALPAALLPFVPLIRRETPMLGVGVVEEEPHVTTVTVHGMVWGDLASALESYLRHLPPAGEEAVDSAAASTVAGDERRRTAALTVRGVR